MRNGRPRDILIAIAAAPQILTRDGICAATGFGRRSVGAALSKLARAGRVQKTGVRKVGGRGRPEHLYDITAAGLAAIGVRERVAPISSPPGDATAAPPIGAVTLRYLRGWCHRTQAELGAAMGHSRRPLTTSENGSTDLRRGKFVAYVTALGGRPGLTLVTRDSAPVDLRGGSARARQLAGMRLAELRRTRGLSQRQVAELIGVTLKHVGRIELGKVNDPRLWVLDGYARAVDGRLIVSARFGAEHFEVDYRSEGARTQTGGEGGRRESRPVELAADVTAVTADLGPGGA